MNNGQACIAQTRDPGAARPLRRGGRRRGRRAWPPWQVGDPMDPATEVGPVVAERQRSADRGVSRQRARGGRDGGPRRRPPGGARRQGLVRRADGVLRRRQQDEDRPGGDLRPGARRDPLRRRRPGRRDRQRLELRAVRLGVDGRQRPRARRGPPGAHRDLHAQRTGARSTSPRRSAASRSRASAASSAPRASRPSWRRSRSPCRPATPRGPEPDARQAARSRGGGTD